MTIRLLGGIVSQGSICLQVIMEKICLMLVALSSSLSVIYLVTDI